MSLREPLFSIVVPAYNAASFLARCVDSVLSQTCADFELILVDDGSKDDTWSLCEEYARRDKRVHAFHQENGGHTSARNYGMLKSNGCYILFLDSDDWLDDTVLDVCKNEIAEYSPDIVIYGIRNTATDKLFTNHIADGRYLISDRENGILDTLLMAADGTFAFPKSLSGKIFRRDIVWQPQLSVPREVLVGEDGACFIGVMLSADRVSVISRTAYNCIVRDDSVSRTADKSAHERFNVLLQYVRDLLKQKNMTIAAQYDRFVVMELYTAMQFIYRSGCDRVYMNAAYSSLIAQPYAKNALRHAHFSPQGCKCIVKKWILRTRNWWLLGWLDGGKVSH